MSSMAMFQDELLKEFSEMTVENLYEITDALLEDIDISVLKNTPGLTYQMRNEIKENQMRNSRRICIYLSELYRRNLLTPNINWFKITPLTCTRCFKVFEKKDYIYTYQYNPEIPYFLDYMCCHLCASNEKCIKLFTKEESIKIHKNDETDKLWNILYSLKDTIKKDYTTLKTIKSFMVNTVKLTRMNGEINGIIDSILYKNGYKISEFKEYLKPDHFRLISAGTNVSEWDIDEQDELLSDLKKMTI